MVSPRFECRDEGGRRVYTQPWFDSHRYRELKTSPAYEI